jgi:hypothetical protein
MAPKMKISWIVRFHTYPRQPVTMIDLGCSGAAAVVR